MKLWYAIVDVHDRKQAKMFFDARDAWTWAAQQIDLKDNYFHYFVDDEAWGDGGGASVSKGDIRYSVDVSEVSNGHTCNTCGQPLPLPS